MKITSFQVKVLHSKTLYSAEVLSAECKVKLLIMVPVCAKLLYFTVVTQKHNPETKQIKMKACFYSFFSETRQANKERQTESGRD